jgi:hypothetical protein
MTLFILILLSISVGYLYYKQYSGSDKSASTNTPSYYSIPYPQTTVVNSAPLEQSLYVPPLNTIDVRGSIELPPTGPALGVGIPVNIRTSTANTPYRQIGILTKTAAGSGARGTDPLILPLFGRSLLNGRDKWQYYTVANSGGVAFNAKLPVSVNGRSCTSEYGCDSVSNGDTVYVEGYDDTFRATIYENATMNYIPF